MIKIECELAETIELSKWGRSYVKYVNTCLAIEEMKLKMM